MDQWDTSNRHELAHISAEIAYLGFKIAVLEAYSYALRKGNPDGIRLGQIYFNLLANRQPDIAAAIRGTPFDPFHKHRITQVVEQRVLELWARLPKYKDQWVV
ncbi:MAG: hypothetical protein EBT80_00350 [Chitinophagales bacterium]|jgi:hypothetical protein|nr:hypothetical protein [Chitinophagales bacterium]